MMLYIICYNVGIGKGVMEVVKMVGLVGKLFVGWEDCWRQFSGFLYQCFCIVFQGWWRVMFSVENSVGGIVCECGIEIEQGFCLFLWGGICQVISIEDVLVVCWVEFVFRK